MTALIPRNRLSRATATLTLTSVVFATGPVTAGSMDDLAWQKRPVIVFAASDADPQATEQLRLLSEAKAEQAERDIVVIEVRPDSVRGGGITLDAQAMRARYGISPDTFAVLLIGKDTGVKRHETRIVPPRALFMQIDGMPMRQREMQRQ